LRGERLGRGAVERIDGDGVDLARAGLGDEGRWAGGDIEHIAAAQGREIEGKELGVFSE
jgi:hypothetical protein